ncbi:TPA: hypothetical protein HA251_02195 [Candidatus Woesearchaeota archaeon]|nr:hypothetical protein [Candidatus Woesearchaeota archaeon]
MNDTYDAFINYTILVNDTANSSGTAQNATAQNVSIDGLPEGVYNLTISSIDSAGNAGNSSSIIIYYDLTAPLVVLDSPSNDTNLTVRTAIMNYTVADNLDPSLQCNLTLDGAVVSALRNITNGGSDNYTAVGLGEGTHAWNVTCWDGNNAVNQVNNRNTSATYIFSVYIPPLLSLIAPPNDTWSNNDTQVFLFNVSDETGITNCSLLLNGSIHTTKLAFDLTVNDTNNFTVSGLNNTYSWAVTCTDSSGGLMVNTTGNRTITIDLVAPQAYINVTSGTWFNTSSPRINITIFDNLDPAPNWTMYVDDAYNANGTAQNGVGTTANLTGVADGYHTIILESRDRAGNVANSTPTIIIIDTNAPNVTLIAPANDTNLSQTDTWLNFTAVDNLAVAMRCNLTLDGTVLEQYNLTNGSEGAHYVSGLASGYHYWNVTCLDNATNRGVSETWRFYVQVPDFAITAGNITFNNTSPVENDTVEVNATVFNIGLLNASDVIVQFWRGDPSIAGATQLGGNITVNLSIGENRTFSVNVTALIGLNQIYVVIDPPTATNGVITESNETNNKANKDFWVGLFEVFAGGSENNLLISDASIIAAFGWNQTNTTGSNVFVADSESTINFIALQAVGRNNTNGTNANTQNDFTEIDERINTTALNDSVNRTFTVAGTPLDYMNITAYKRSITMIPAVNSTNTSVFRTGILWDASDGASPHYNKSQDIVFVTVMDQNQAGYFGTYDYEIKVPAKLRDYIAGGGTVTFYAELR